ncbi:YlqD family protein [Bacillus solimangrovi]|uniref:YlqD protein n=1 Tax=Bacillus solimangrovi TaxID=1305675 RepID=A0A1E5LAX9_9BACI|nr:YlqD family protein [Bacillus solimangrovi]OEH91238.1 hypothetical protein BFG57_06365 [Bacillus solimangrovi]
MKIIKSVSVNYVLTENMKSELLRKYQTQSAIHERACEQLLFEEKKLARKYKNQKNTVVEKISEELKERKASINNIIFKREQLNKLEIGSEIQVKDVDSIVEVNEGDNWDELMHNETIVIKDGIVQEIRCTGGVNE